MATKKPSKRPSKKLATTTGTHTFGRPRRNQKSLAFTGAPSKPGSAFQPLPKPTGKPPFHLDLRDVVPPDLYAAIAKAQHLGFHVAGDLGGINFAVPQERVAQGLEEDFVANPSDPAVNSAFLYVLGDCVYFPEKSLDGFVRNFCAAKPGTKTPESHDSPRTAMIQPNVYWTLLTPVVSIIGLYSNVPEHGVLHPDQLAWLEGELKSLPASLPLLITLHHPPYSADDHHGGSKPMHDALDGAFAKVGRWPDMVLAGHVHDYQRFTRRLASNNRQISYLVAGAGGYHNLHAVAKVSGAKPTPPVTLPVSGDTVTLESYVDDRHGFLRLDAGPGAIAGKYFTVPRPQESWSQPPKLADSFRLDTRTHRLA